MIISSLVTKMKYFIAIDLFVIVYSKALCSNAGEDACFTWENWCNRKILVIARKYGDMCEVLEPQDNLEEYLMTKELLNGIFGTVPSLISSFWWASGKKSGIRVLQSPKSRCSDCSADSVRPVLKFSFFFIFGLLAQNELFELSFPL